MKDAISTETPVGLLARSTPSLIPLFHDLGIDYCCRGRDTLAQAAARAGQDAGEVLAAVRNRQAGSVTDRRSWAEEPVAELCDHIVAVHHGAAREMLERACLLAEKVARAHAGRDPRWAQVSGVLAGLREEMLDHMVREERVLFPWLKRLENPESITFGPPWSVKRPIDCMEHDHVAVSESLARLRALTDNYRVPVGACVSVEALLRTLEALDADTRLHIHKENNILFPRGVELEQRRGQASGRVAADTGALQ